MTSPLSAAGGRPARRRDLQKEQTRRDLALAAFNLARAHGLANVRISQIATAVGVSPRTFNNYFPSKEAAVIWPVTLQARWLADSLTNRPPAEPLADALVAAIAAQYRRTKMDSLPPGWLGQFRALVAAEPTLHGEYLKATTATEAALADAIGRRAGFPPGQLESHVLAAVTVAAERTAVQHWSRAPSPRGPLVDVVRTAVHLAVRGMTAPATPSLS
jgi:AcrR family transcriptional regulator